MNDVPTAVSVPVLLGFLSLLGFVIKWLIQRETTNAEQTNKRIDKLEVDLAEMNEARSAERHFKHDYRTRLAELTLAVRLLMASARRCTCGEMASVVELVEQTKVLEGVEHGR